MLTIWWDIAVSKPDEFHALWDWYLNKYMIKLWDECVRNVKMEVLAVFHMQEFLRRCLAISASFHGNICKLAPWCADPSVGGYKWAGVGRGVWRVAVLVLWVPSGPPAGERATGRRGGFPSRLVRWVRNRGLGNKFPEDGKHRALEAAIAVE